MKILLLSSFLFCVVAVSITNFTNLILEFNWYIFVLQIQAFSLVPPYCIGKSFSCPACAAITPCQCTNAFTGKLQNYEIPTLVSPSKWYPVDYKLCCACEQQPACPPNEIVCFFNAQ